MKSITNPMKIKWLLISMAMMLCHCAETPCKRTQNEDGQPVIVCPRGEPVTLNDEVDEPCYQDGDGIICGDKQFDAQGRRIGTSNVAVDLQQDEDLKRLDELAPDNRTNRPCVITKDTIVCGDKQASTPAGVDSTTTDCRMRPLIGHGLRIVCIREAGTTIIMPDGVNEETQCTRVVDGVVCDDGTRVEDEDFVDNPQSCPNPTLEQTVSEELVLQCMEQLACELQCKDEDCPCTELMCDEALDPAVVCADGDDTKTYTMPDACGAKGDVFWIKNARDAQAFEALRCKNITGDVIFMPDDEADERTLPSTLLEALKGVEYISGHLRVESVRLSGSKRNYEAMALDLRMLAGGLIVKHNRDLPYVVGKAPLAYSFGDVRFENNEGMDLVVLESLRYIRGDLYVSGNPDLELIELNRDMKIDGLFGITENTQMDACDLQDWLKWSLSHAQATLILSAHPHRPDC